MSTCAVSEAVIQFQCFGVMTETISCRVRAIWQRGARPRRVSSPAAEWPFLFGEFAIHAPAGGATCNGRK